MIEVRTPQSKNFNYRECKKMYGENQALINDDATFDEVIRDTHFFAFYNEGELILCIYLFRINGKFWINGYGIRKRHLLNKKCFTTFLRLFPCDVWAESDKKPAIYGLLVSGFKKFKDNIYVYRHR